MVISGNNLTTTNNTIVSNEALQTYGFKNVLINGDFRISQRGSYTTATSASSGAYYLDRFTTWLGTVTATVQQTTVTINGVVKNAIRYQATSSGTGYIGFNQPIESMNIKPGTTYTASCYVRSNNANCRFRINNLTNDSQSNVFTNNGSWEKVSYTFTVESSGSSTFRLGLITYSSSNTAVSITSGDYIEVTDFQLEQGSVATPFEQRPYGMELALCQRYYTKTPALFGEWTASSSLRCSGFLAVEMRTIPSVTLLNTYAYHEVWNQSGYNGISSFDYTSNSTKNVDIRMNSSATSGHSYGQWAFVEANTFGLSAEL